MIIIFSYSGQILAKQSAKFATFKKKNGDIGTKAYTPARIRTYENALRWTFKKQLAEQHAGFKLSDRFLVHVRCLKFYFNAPDYVKRQMVKDNLKEIPKHTKPDITDNLMKPVFDALEGIAYVNDSRITSLERVEKVWTLDGERLVIELELIEA